MSPLRTSLAVTALLSLIVLAACVQQPVTSTGQTTPYAITTLPTAAGSYAGATINPMTGSSGNSNGSASGDMGGRSGR